MKWKSALIIFIVGNFKTDKCLMPSILIIDIILFLKITHYSLVITFDNLLPKYFYFIFYYTFLVFLYVCSLRVSAMSYTYVTYSHTSKKMHAFHKDIFPRKSTSLMAHVSCNQLNGLPHSLMTFNYCLL